MNNIRNWVEETVNAEIIYVWWRNTSGRRKNIFCPVNRTTAPGISFWIFGMKLGLHGFSHQNYEPRHRSYAAGATGQELSPQARKECLLRAISSFCEEKYLRVTEFFFASTFFCLSAQRPPSTEVDGGRTRHKCIPIYVITASLSKWNGLAVLKGLLIWNKSPNSSV